MGRDGREIGASLTLYSFIRKYRIFAKDLEREERK